MKIRHKLPAAIIGIAVASIAIMTGIAYWDARNALEHAVFEKLEAIETGRAHELKTYLEQIETELILLSDNETVIHAIEEFDAGWAALSGDRTAALQRAYIQQNPHPTGEKDKLADAGDGTLYSKAHAHHHPWFHEVQKRRGYYDVFLIDKAGNVVYSVFKEADFATNVQDGKWADTGLGKAFRAANGKKHGDITFVDFEPYAPSAGAPAAFMATPATDHEGNHYGVLVFQMPFGKINTLLQRAEGMGETGDTFIVGADNYMRSDSRLASEPTVLSRKVEGPHVNAALRGEQGTVISENHEGETVVAAYSAIDMLGVRWAVIVEKALDEVEAPVRAMTVILVLAGLAVAAVTAVIGFIIARGLSTPILNMNATMRRLADKDWSTEILYTDRADEIGEMAQAVEVFKTNGIEVERLEAEQKEAEKRAEEEKRRLMNQLADDFTAQVGSIVDAVASTATELEATAQSVSAIAEETTAQSSSVAAAAEESSVNVQTVSSASEEMSASIREMTSQVGQSRDAAATANQNVTETSEQVSHLSEAADAIGKVIDLISDIAEQTNLLALNATIEAARAGEAGKGFSVVAGEVKALATQTQKATEEIRSQIEGIQTQSQGAVGAITGMREVIGRVAEITEAIAEGIEQQATATSEISRNAQEAAAGTQDVSHSVTTLTDAAQQSAAAATELLQAAGELSQQGETLRSKVDSFINQVRAA